MSEAAGWKKWGNDGWKGTKFQYATWKSSRGLMYIMPIVNVNQEFQEQRPGWNKKAFIWGLLGLQLRRHRFKKLLNCVPLDYVMAEACKGKRTQGYINCQELRLELARSKDTC